MDVKEAIEFLEDIYDWDIASDIEEKAEKNIPEIIALLQQSEKYRQMWEGFCVNEGDLVKVVNCVKRRYEQKYFSRGVI